MLKQRDRKTNSSINEIQEMHSRIQLIKPQKNKDILVELNTDLLKKIALYSK
jgi:hypothetical protein